MNYSIETLTGRAWTQVGMVRNLDVAKQFCALAMRRRDAEGALSFDAARIKQGALIVYQETRTEAQS